MAGTSNIGLANTLQSLAGRRTPCPSWAPPEPGDEEAETYDHWRRRFTLRLSGEEALRTPAAAIARDFALAMKGEAQDRLLDMTDAELNAPGDPANNVEPGYKVALVRLDERFWMDADEHAKEA